MIAPTTPSVKPSTTELDLTQRGLLELAQQLDDLQLHVFSELSYATCPSCEEPTGPGSVLMHYDRVEYTCSECQHETTVRLDFWFDRQSWRAREAQR